MYSGQCFKILQCFLIGINIRIVSLNSLFCLPDDEWLVNMWPLPKIPLLSNCMFFLNGIKVNQYKKIKRRKKYSHVWHSKAIKLNCAVVRQHNFWINTFFYYLSLRQHSCLNWQIIAIWFVKDGTFLCCASFPLRGHTTKHVPIKCDSIHTILVNNCFVNIKEIGFYDNRQVALR